MSMTATAPSTFTPIQPLGDEVIVWSKPRCVQCVATYRSLDSHGIDYRVEDLTEHPEMLEHLRENDMLQAPVVMVADDMWSGFRPDKIEELAAR